VDNRRGRGCCLPSLRSVTQIRVSPQDIARLGLAVAGLADDLRWSADRVRDSSWALGRGASRPVLLLVVGDFEHQRLRLGRVLAELGELGQVAGGAYAQVERDVGSAVGGGGGPC
jgi:hypothetical protein